MICTATMLLVSCNNSSDDKKTDGTTPVDTSKKMADVKMETPPPAAALDSATKMKNWMMCMTPGDMHKMIASWNGTWSTEITAYEPGKPPTKSTGTTVNKMILGGRYQESLNTGNMMGMPFEGHGMLGYNNATKLLENTWVDNMGTSISMLKGAWDSATKSVTLTGKMTNPETLAEMDYKEIFKVVDEKTQTMEMYGPGPDGKETKMMELKFTRK